MPWYSQPATREWLQPKAHKVRNLTLILGYYTGLAALIGAPVAVGVYVVAPGALQAWANQYPAMPAGAVAGFLGGVAAAVWYRRRYPGNPRGPGVLVPLVTGLGTICGFGFAAGDMLGGTAAVVLCLMGALAYVYMEALPPEAEE
ncbi:MAG TPA: hypothetical protein VD902_16740 [Symbiobacteriaceae bacterium]|nr:hypothetical protein [Symbiobacteriaceae bacterium]